MMIATAILLLASVQLTLASEHQQEEQLQQLEERISCTELHLEKIYTHLNCTERLEDNDTMLAKDNAQLWSELSMLAEDNSMLRANLSAERDTYMSLIVEMSWQLQNLSGK